MTEGRVSEPQDAAPPRPARRRGSLKVYLGAAPGSGKTFAMLREGRDRRGDGEDVVVGFVETHGRPRTQEAVGRLEVVPRIVVEYRGTVIEEMDLDAVLRRHPHVALIDELAHTNAPGVKHDKRWRDVEELRDSGIDVVTTLNVQHLESVKDLVEHITGINIRETVPDRVVDGADDLQFIDIAPEALRKRMRHGNIYTADKVEPALANFFRAGNLAALREIALRLVAQRVATAQAGAVTAAPQDVLVAVSGSASSAPLIRRGVRVARRFGGLCTVVRTGPPTAEQEWRRLAAQLECSVIERPDGDVGRTVVGVARELMVHHVVVGEPRAQSGIALFKRSLVDRLVDDLPDVDVHVVARFHAAPAVRGGGDGAARPDPDELLRAAMAPAQRRGGLRIYLGYARGCGTTTVMLDEARRRRARGTDVVVAAVDPRRCRTDDDLGSPALPLLGGRASPAAQGRLDVEALLSRNPDVAIIDDLAVPTTLGGVASAAIPRILASGITVIATVHLSDMRSTVDTLGALLRRSPERRVVEEAVLDAADELELVDATPGELVGRVRDGDIVPASEAASALQGEFRPQVLASLRELAFRRIAQHTDHRLLDYMRERRIEAPWEARPRIVACVPPVAGMERLIERAAAVAGRRGEAFTAVTVRHGNRDDVQRQVLGGYAALTHQLGGELVTLDGDDVATTLATYARHSLATEVLAARGSRRSHRTLRKLIRHLDQVDVVILAFVEPRPSRH